MAIWIEGDGPFATVAHCPSTASTYGPFNTTPRRSSRAETVQLHQRRADAERALSMIDSSGCGGSCHNDHEIVDLRQDQSDGIDD
jgi:hypothetical protein